MPKVAVDAAPASRALDALVAQCVLGLEPPEGFTFDGEQWVKCVSKFLDLDSNDRDWIEWDECWPLHYSTSDYAAMGAVDHVLASGKWDVFAMEWQRDAPEWWAWLIPIDDGDWMTGSADTRPLAISRMLLKSAGIEEVDL